MERYTCIMVLYKPVCLVFTSVSSQYNGATNRLSESSQVARKAWVLLGGNGEREKEKPRLHFNYKHVDIITTPS